MSARRCRACGITEKGARSDQAVVSPAGTVHLTYVGGRLTFCGRRVTRQWRAAASVSAEAGDDGD